VNVFLHTNVLMDVLLDRQPFVAESEQVWFLADRGKIRGFVSALSFPNVYYIVRKVRGAEAAMAMMATLRDTFTPVPLDEQILNQAMDAGFPDLEDAIQHASARRADADCFLTRNADDFPQSDELPVLTPAEFLSAHRFE